MYRPGLIIPCLFFVLFQVKSQSNISQEDGTSSPDAISNFQPSLVVVIGILCVMFSVTFILLIYAKYCNRGAFARAEFMNRPGTLVRSASRFSGIDKTVIESLPFFRFSSLKGSREGLECAVCLSKFEDVEILRLLPKCKHAFHINCVDEWLKNHSSCPLCRCKVNPEDPTIFTYSNSMRFQSNQSAQREDSNIELYVQREENHQESSRFSIGSSFRKILKSNNKEEEYLIKDSPEEEEKEVNDQEKFLHKLNHKIIVSDVVFKNRWSSLNSSDLMLLNKEMLNEMSSNRFSYLDANKGHFTVTRGGENQEILKIKEELEMKRLFENKVSSISKNTPSSILGLVGSSSSGSNNIVTSHPSIVTSSANRRAVSEITSFSRFGNLGFKNNNIRGSPDLAGSNVKEENVMRVWLPIAKRTVEWFANREKRSQQIEGTEETLDV